MLDLFTIFTKGGIVLFTANLRSVRLSSVDELISQIFVESRHGENSALLNNQKFHWTFENELDLVFVVAYQKILQLSYIDELLNVLKELFCSQYKEDIKNYFDQNNLLRDEENQIPFPTFDFDTKFNSTVKGIEKRHAQQAKNKTPRKFEETKKYQSTLEASKKAAGQDNEKEELGMSTPESISPILKPMGFKPKSKKKGLKNDKDENVSTDTEGDKKKREKRVWAGQMSKAKMKSLDYSEAQDTSDSEIINSLVDDNEKGEYNEDGTYDVKDIDGAEEEDYEYIEQFTKPKVETESRLMSIFNSLTGQHIINEDELIPVLANMKEHLVQKNVAEEIASHLCESVKSDIVGKKLGGFQSLAKAVSDSLRESITQILTPGTSMDIIKEINNANTVQKRPYVMSFIGVNGVGKSTNLSKTCFWLLQNRKKVLVAACDTFRSGAVEQLGVHVKNLLKLNQNGSVQLYERGYGKDSASIAKDAIAFGASNGFDVVLIDTAGRMQNNESLMKALARLVAVNQPDKVIFVGEALVGNEAVDQLSKFNQALEDFSGSAQPRKIDGIILTKFDTIDDKVGAALSMTFTSRAPILFVGTGQTYTDLKKMNVDHVVNALLKK
ncbi:P-loop containing nucleoside triphosphate hydrolase protein [Neoconidiobolus thromboides FSU 785]|nr:P-loop containing nucleoside triphosphate hydrolase protein [Neoconidiobolus thromboides FSU 785]